MRNIRCLIGGQYIARTAVKLIGDGDCMQMRRLSTVFVIRKRLNRPPAVDARPTAHHTAYQQLAGLANVTVKRKYDFQNCTRVNGTRFVYRVIR